MNEPTTKTMELISAYGGNFLIPSESDCIGHILKLSGQFETDDIARVSKYLEEDRQINRKRRLFVDIGANIGTHSVSALKEHGYEKLLAIEPSEENYRLLTANLCLNGMMSRATCFQAAASERDGIETLFHNPDNCGDYRLNNNPLGTDTLAHGGFEQVKTINIHSHLSLHMADIPPADVLCWIDTQGHEIPILRSLKPLIENGLPVVIEFWPYGLEQQQGSFEQLASILRSSRLQIANITSEAIKPLTLEDLKLLWHKFRATDTGTPEGASYSNILIHTRSTSELIYPEATSSLDFYSQNFEDVFLARCFQGRTDGFYIDVGAQHEEADSVTRHFYEVGWSGINIEPVSEFAETFRCRERDQTVCCAAGSEETMMPMAISLHSGLSSFDKENASKTESMGLLAETRMIKIRRLNDILADLGLPEKRFEFLKVDVEGYELEVIKGIDLSRYCPRIILCEVTKPNTSVKTIIFEDLCHVIESFDYVKLFFDGLNQWWCEESFYEELAGHFLLPPGVIDAPTITPYGGTLARKQLRQIQAVLKETEGRLHQANEQIATLQHQANEQIATLQHQANEQIATLQQCLQVTHQQLDDAIQGRDSAWQQIAGLRSSNSWKLTGPLRKAAKGLQKLWRLT
jgi:FkbM family methyltransferase